MLGSSRMFHAFAMATPGMRELLSMGKVWELAQLERRTRGAAPYDFVIVDAPATGHGVGLLRTPKTFAEIARVGPIARQGSTIATTIADREFTGDRRRRHAGGDGGQRDAGAARRARSRRADARAGRRQRAVPRAVRRRRGRRARRGGGRGRARRWCARRLQAAAVRARPRGDAARAVRSACATGSTCRSSQLPYVFADHLGLEELAGLADELEACLPAVRAPVNR